jgi:ribosomal protein RSM22 (predicted rRNA methylase)
MLLTKILPFLLYEFKTEKELIQAIEELSLKFTQRREQITDYLSDKRLASAYTAFYLTSNAPKLKTVLNWMPSSFVDQLKSSTLIDLGSGPGTFSLAFRELVGQPVKVVQIETSATMREQAKKLWNGLYPGEDLLQFDHEKIELKGEKFLLFGHSANEMGASTTLRYIKNINPDHILFIEPGTKDFFPQMLKIRDELIATGFNILFPCPTAESCPLLDSVNDWCHQFIQVRQDPELERLSQMAKKDRRLLPLTVQAFSRTSQRPTLVTRIIRVFPETKFSFEWEVCELNKMKHYQIMKRGLSKKVLDQLSEALAGSALEVEVDKELEKCTRAKVLRLNNIALEP